MDNDRERDATAPGEEVLGNLLERVESSLAAREDRSRSDIARVRNLLDLALKGSNVCVFAQDRDLRYTWVHNPPEALSPGMREGASDDDVLPRSVVEDVRRVKLAGLQSGESQFMELRVAEASPEAWFDLWIDPIKTANGEIVGLACASVDVTERKLSEQHLRLLLRELSHRSKNLLAVIQGIAGQTARGSDSIDQFMKRFVGRLHSLSAAHEILTDTDWRGADLAELVQGQIRQFAGSQLARVDCAGPAIHLRPNAAQHVGLAIHELISNAVSFGALSQPRGRVAVNWAMRSLETGADATEFLVLHWHEQHGPAVSAPSVRNFGRVLLEDVVPTAVGGSARLEFCETGISYELAISPVETT